jgi:hypothetical protein
MCSFQRRCGELEWTASYPLQGPMRREQLNERRRGGGVQSKCIIFAFVNRYEYKQHDEVGR